MNNNIEYISGDTCNFESIENGDWFIYNNDLYEKVTKRRKKSTNNNAYNFIYGTWHHLDEKIIVAKADYRIIS